MTNRDSWQSNGHQNIPNIVVIFRLICHILFRPGYFPSALLRVIHRTHGFMRYGQPVNCVAAPKEVLMTNEANEAIRTVEKERLFAYRSFSMTPLCWLLLLLVISVFVFQVGSLFVSAPHCDEDMFLNVSWRIAKTADWLPLIQSKETFIAATNYLLFDAVMAAGIKMFGDSRILLRFFALLLSWCGLILCLLGLQRVRFTSVSEPERPNESNPLFVFGICQKLVFLCLCLLSSSVFYTSHFLRPECVALFVLGLLFWSLTLVNRPVIQTGVVFVCSFVVPWCGLHFVVPAGGLIFLTWLFFRFPFRLVLVPVIGMAAGLAAFFPIYSALDILDVYRFQMVAYGVAFRPIHNLISFLCDFPKNITRTTARLLPLPLAVIGMLLFSKIPLRPPFLLSGRQRIVVCVSVYSVVTFLCMTALRGETGGVWGWFVLHIPLSAAIACWCPDTFRGCKNRVALKRLWFVAPFLIIPLRWITLWPGNTGRSKISESEYVTWASGLTTPEDVLLTSRTIGLFGSVQETFYVSDLLYSLRWRQFQTTPPVLHAPLENRITLAILDNGAICEEIMNASFEATPFRWKEIGEPLIGSAPSRWATSTNRLVYRAYRRDISVP